jgi:hypothetical protein
MVSLNNIHRYNRMNFTFDPLLSLSVIFLQVSNKYLKINTTKAQEKILMHPFSQALMYSVIIFYTTRSVAITMFILTLSYLIFFVLFNEQHRFNLYPREWLYKEHLINNKPVSYKDTYKTNVKNYHI